MIIITHHGLLLVALAAFVLGILAAIPTAPFPERLWGKVVFLFFICVVMLWEYRRGNRDPTIRDARWN